MDRRKVLEQLENNKDFFNNVIYPNIEKYRKGNMTISVIDKSGNIIPNAKVKKLGATIKENDYGREKATND